MSLANDFKKYCFDIMLDNIDDIKKTSSNIAQKLNNFYWGLNNKGTKNLYIVGSVGRETAIKGSSDLDIIFDLPNDLFLKYNSYETNGQSALLQDVKEVLLEKFPNSDISGDGQVVVIEFNKYTIELVPAFKQDNNTFKYPDSNQGGSWKITKPLEEQIESQKCNILTNGKYFDFCHMLRGWKNTIGFEIGGLLLDTLIYNCFRDNNYFSNKNYGDYYNILIEIFNYFKNQNKEQLYWYAIGSNQKVYKKNNKFINKAKKAYDKLISSDSNSQEINETLRDLFGEKFPQNNKVIKSSEKNIHYYVKEADTEQFIEELYSTDIKYTLIIDCKITQNGFRDFFLKDYLKLLLPLTHNKTLDFFIKYTNCPKPYSIFWKVRNVGIIALQKNMIRGQIVQGGATQREHTNFWGNHYVECYLIKNGICVARNRISVPIGNE